MTAIANGLALHGGFHQIVRLLGARSADPPRYSGRILPKASMAFCDALRLLPEYLGGSADLAPSNLTIWSGSKPINEDAAGNYILG
jgi:transketolase